MRILKIRKELTIVLLIVIFGFNFNKNNEMIILNNSNNIRDFEEEVSQVEFSEYDPKYKMVGVIPYRSGKIFSNFSESSLNCRINRYDSNLNIQPNLFIPGWNLTHANMLFEDIYALNYTKNIEIESTEFIMSHSETDPIYVYQKFSVEMNQYVNNVSIFIQDIIDGDCYTEENSWEVSIVNCSNDPLGTPNPNETLGTLIKPHPNDIVAHWETFDFKNSEIGAIFLNKSKTNSTLIDGTYKYWYAIKVKIPPNDNQTGGGPKFLYINPDGSDPTKIGEGETFMLSPQFLSYNSFNEEVIENITIIGETVNGDISSFKSFDEDRITITSYEHTDHRDYICLTVRLEVDNLTTSEYTWEELKTINIDKPLKWENILNNYFFSLSLVLNIDDNDGLRNKQLALYNPDSGEYDVMTHDMILDSEIEYLQNYTVIIPEEKLFLIQHMDTSPNMNNSLIFRLYYDNYLYYDGYDLSINLFDMYIEEVNIIDVLQKHDPIIHKVHYSNKVTSLNSTIITPNDKILESIKGNDDKFLQILGASDSNTTSIEFKFNILTNLNSSLWDVDDPKDWILNLPNPIISQIDFRISSNVSIQDPSNLTHAMLEIYNGGNFSQFSGIEWRQFLNNKTFADKDENTKILQLDSSYTWYIMHLINESNDNSLRVRLRFIGNGTLKGINVSIDEFTLNFHIQNAIPSDIVSKIGLGLNSNSLKPQDIHLQNFGIPISNDGIWEIDICNGTPTQGFYYFNISSIWPEVHFNVSGVYSTKKSQDFEWEYYLLNNNTRILWNISADLSYYSYYENIEESMSLQFSVPSDWELMDIYDCSVSPPNPNGGWYSTIQAIGNFNTITVYNIYDGSWKISMNSSKTTLLFNVNATNTYIDKMIMINSNIKNYYGGDMYFEIYNLNSEIIFSQTNKLNESTFENSASHYWDIFSTTDLAGIYYLKAYWILYNETHTLLALNTTEIIVSKYNINLEILNIDELSKTFVYGSDILIEGRLTNNKTGAIIEGEPIFAETYDKSLNLIETKSDITNNEGIIQLEYTLPIGYSKISIGLIYNASGTYYSAGQSTQFIVINQISLCQYYLNIFINFLPYIGIILGLAITTIVGMKYRKSKLRKYWAEEAIILDDLIRTAYIMVIHKDVGVSIFNKQISLTDINPNLISGFLQAISAFRYEIKMEQEAIVKDQGFEMDYYEFKIVIADGDYIRVALIVDGSPTQTLKENQKLFTQKFEERFKLNLIDFDGDITIFKNADDLLEEFFNVSLVFPLRVGELSKVIKVKKLEKALMEIAEEIQKDRDFFFISRLLNLAIAGRKASRDEIISAILSLKEKGLIIPANFD